MECSWGKKPIRSTTAWATAAAEIRLVCAAAIGQAVEITRPQWGVGRNKVMTRDGWVHAVTRHGLVFAETVIGAWGQEQPDVLRTFISWPDLWAEDHRTTLRGTWSIATDRAVLEVDVGEWVSEWIARGRHAMVEDLAAGSESVGREEAAPHDRLSGDAAAGRPGRLDWPARESTTERTELVGPLPFSSRSAS